MKHYKGKQADTAAKDQDVAVVERLMKEYNIPSKGKTLSGHFSPSDAIDVLKTAESRGRSISEIVKAAVRLGLPSVKKHFPPTRSQL